MNHNPDDEIMSEEQRIWNEIRPRMAELMYLRNQLELHRLRVSAVILPAHLKPKEPGESRLMGMPVVWSEEEKWGIATYLLEPKKEE